MMVSIIELEGLFIYRIFLEEASLWWFVSRLCFQFQGFLTDLPDYRLYRFDTSESSNVTVLVAELTRTLVQVLLAS